MLRFLFRQRHTAATVWFNAWHYSKEDPLLAYLFEAIKSQAVEGQWLFYPKLAWRRARSPLGLLLASILAYAGYHLYNHWAETLAFLSAPGWQLLSAVLAAAASLWAAYINFLKPFRINPDKLLEEVKSSLQLPSLTGKTDLRHQFLKDLSTVIACLPGKRLVLFLDDLDRCPPNKVADMLEAINFLSGATNCFFILGIDREQVQSAVGLHYQTIALERAQQFPRPGVAVNREAAKREFSKRFLEKILNVRVQLPQISADHSSRFVNHGMPEKQGTRVNPRLVLAPIVAVLLLLLGGAFYFSRQPDPPALATQKQTTSAATPFPDAPPEKKAPRNKNRQIHQRPRRHNPPPPPSLQVASRNTWRSPPLGSFYSWAFSGS